MWTRECRLQHQQGDGHCAWGIGIVKLQEKAPQERLPIARTPQRNCAPSTSCERLVVSQKKDLNLCVGKKLNGVKCAGSCAVIFQSIGWPTCIKTSSPLSISHLPDQISCNHGRIRIRDQWSHHEASWIGALLRGKQSSRDPGRHRPIAYRGI